MGKRRRMPIERRAARQAIQRAHVAKRLVADFTRAHTSTSNAQHAAATVIASSADYSQAVLQQRGLHQGEQKDSKQRFYLEARVLKFSHPWSATAAGMQATRSPIAKRRARRARSAARSGNLKAVCSKRDKNKRAVGTALAPVPCQPCGPAVADACVVKWFCPSLTCGTKQYRGAAVKCTSCQTKRDGKVDVPKAPKALQAGSPTALVQTLTAVMVDDGGGGAASVDAGSVQY